MGMPARPELAADALRRLRAALARLFPSAAEARVLLHDAGVPDARINLDGSAESRWFHVLDEALKHDRLRELVRHARAAYGDAPELRAVGEALGPAPEDEWRRGSPRARGRGCSPRWSPGSSSGSVVRGAR